MADYIIRELHKLREALGADHFLIWEDLDTILILLSICTSCVIYISILQTLFLVEKLRSKK